MRRKISNVLHWTSEKIYDLANRIYTEPEPEEIPWQPGYPLLMKLPSAYWDDQPGAINWSNKYLEPDA